MKGTILILMLVTSSTAVDAAPRKRAPVPHAVAPAPPPDATEANKAFVRGDYVTAITLYTTLLADQRLTTEEKGTLFLNRGVAQLLLNRPDNAAADLRQALVLNPNDTEAAGTLAAIQNGTRQAAAPSQTSNLGWGPLARLPGHIWLLTEQKPKMYVQFEWTRVGVSMIFAGKDGVGNRLEGQYFLDPASNAIRVTSTYMGKTNTTDVTVTADQFVETMKGRRGLERQTTQIQPDGTFNVTTQKPKGKDWQTTSVAVLMPTTASFTSALGWPDEPLPAAPSFWKGIGDSLKSGALAGFQAGAQDGVHDAVQDRIRKATKTTYQPGLLCRTVSGAVVACPQ